MRGPHTPFAPAQAGIQFFFHLLILGPRVRGDERQKGAA